MNEEKTTAHIAAQQEVMRDYLRGYRRASPAEFERIANDSDCWWQEARFVLARRRMRLLEALPDELLGAIADNSINVWHLAKELRETE